MDTKTKIENNVKKKFYYILFGFIVLGIACSLAFDKGRELARLSSSVEIESNI